MTRSAWIVLSVALILIVGILFITQSKTLSDTQAALITQANAAVATATQAAIVQAQVISDTQQEAATTQAQVLMDSQSQASTAQAQAVSDAQNEAATAQADAVLNARVEATIALVTRIAQVQDQAATAQAVALNEAANTAATAQAQAVSDAENNAATATIAQGQAQIQANIAATQAALAENNAATATIAQGQAQIQAEFAATVQADLQATISVLEARLTEAAAPPAGEQTTSTATVSREGWERIEGNGVALQLPPTWFGGDLLNNPDVLADAMTMLGPENAQLSQLFARGPELMRLIAFDQDSPPSFITNVNVIREELALTLTLSAYLDLAVPQLPASLTVLENDIMQVNGREVGRLVITGDFPVGQVKILQYSILEDKQVWVVTYTTTTRDFEAMRPIFEASFETFETQSSSA